MSGKTPKTGTVRFGWASGHPRPNTTDIDERLAEFDRWLAAHDAEVLAAAGVAPQPEPEYEYRCVHPSPDVTAVVRSDDWEAHSRKCPGVIERRIKAGAWELVPNQTGETP